MWNESVGVQSDEIVKHIASLSGNEGTHFILGQFTVNLIISKMHNVYFFNSEMYWKLPALMATCLIYHWLNVRDCNEHTESLKIS